ncbi:unnamed protein product [Sphagnum jensenii]|uniref:Uncharacterized protein n=1 Tax=Sphagnum jensenii TaxID=128206 RepID=A0ABP0VIF3_9BRYO
MAYTPFLPNQFDQNLIPVDIRAKYFEEYLGLSPFTTFMGSSPEDAIQIFETNNGDGLSYRVSFRKDLNYQNPIIGFDQAEGAEQAVQIFYDEISLQLRRFVDVLMGVPLVRKATPIDVYGTLRPLLLNAQRRNLVLSLLNAACGSPAVGGIYTSALAGGNGPTVDRVIYAAAGGGSPASYNAVINTAVNNMGAVGAAGSGLSNDNQPEGISGARYRGMVEGVMIYECPELNRFAVTSTGGNNITASWNLFLGAQAFEIINLVSDLSIGLDTPTPDDQAVFVRYLNLAHGRTFPKNSRRQPCGQPWAWYYASQNLYVYPLTTSDPDAGSGQLGVSYIAQPVSLSLATVSADLPYPAHYHPVLVDGTCYYLFQTEAGFKNDLKMKLALGTMGAGQNRIALLPQESFRAAVLFYVHRGLNALRRQAVLYTQVFTPDLTVTEATVVNQSQFSFKTQTPEKYAAETSVEVVYTSTSGIGNVLSSLIVAVNTDQNNVTTITVEDNSFPDEDNIQITAISYSSGSLYVYDFQLQTTGKAFNIAHYQNNNLIQIKTKAVPSLDLSDKEDLPDNLEAITVVNGMTAFLGRKQTYLYTGSEPLGGAPPAPGKPLFEYQFAVSSTDAVDPVVRQNVASMMTSNRAYRGLSVVFYADNTTAYPIYGDRNGERLISFLWALPVVHQRGKRWANKRYEIQIEYPSSFVLETENTLSLLISGDLRKSFTLSSVDTLPFKGDLLKTIPLVQQARPDPNNPNPQSLGMRLDEPYAYPKGRLKFASSQFLQPPTAEMFDAELNAILDKINTLAAAINATVAGNIPGSDNPDNAGVNNAGVVGSGDEQRLLPLLMPIIKSMASYQEGGGNNVSFRKIAQVLNNDNANVGAINGAILQAGSVDFGAINPTNNPLGNVKFFDAGYYSNNQSGDFYLFKNFTAVRTDVDSMISPLRRVIAQTIFLVSVAFAGNSFRYYVTQNTTYSFRVTVLGGEAPFAITIIGYQ